MYRWMQTVGGKAAMVRGTIKRTSSICCSTSPAFHCRSARSCLLVVRSRSRKENIRILPQIKLPTVNFFELSYHLARCCHSSTRHGLCGSGIQFRWGQDFPHPSRPAPVNTQPPVNGYRISFLAVKRPAHGVDHPPHLVPRIKEEYSFPSTLPLGLGGLF